MDSKEVTHAGLDPEDAKAAVVGHVGKLSNKAAPEPPAAQDRTPHEREVERLIKQSKTIVDTAVAAGTGQTDPMLQWFEFDHLPDPLKAVSAQFWALACSLIALLPRNPERTVALRKLLEAKDCAVRSKLYVG